MSATRAWLSAVDVPAFAAGDRPGSLGIHAAVRAPASRGQHPPSCRSGLRGPFPRSGRGEPLLPTLRGGPPSSELPAPGGMVGATLRSLFPRSQSGGSGQTGSHSRLAWPGEPTGHASPVPDGGGLIGLSPGFAHQSHVSSAQFTLPFGAVPAARVGSLNANSIALSVVAPSVSQPDIRGGVLATVSAGQGPAIRRGHPRMTGAGWFEVSSAFRAKAFGHRTFEGPNAALSCCGEEDARRLQRGQVAVYHASDSTSGSRALRSSSMRTPMA